MLTKKRSARRQNFHNWRTQSDERPESGQFSSTEFTE